MSKPLTLAEARAKAERLKALPKKQAKVNVDSEIPPKKQAPLLDQSAQDDAPATTPVPPPEKPPRTRKHPAARLRPSRQAPTETPPAPPTHSVERTPDLQREADAAFSIPYEAPFFDFDHACDDPEAELASRELCRRHLLPFIQRFRPKYKAGWVHADICRRFERFLQQVENGEEPRLLLMMPPRSGKSEISSRHMAAWVLGQHPDWEIIAASHTASLTMSFSRYLRDLMGSEAYNAVFPDAVLDPSSRAVENWNLTKGGGYLAAGVGTGITGRGAHILLLDDLVKDIEAADSLTIRDNTWEWYISTAYTRLAPGGGVLGLMCMTGDTLVTMADGSQMRLDAVRADDMIATYANGLLATSRVAAMKSSGRDFVYKITTTSGKIVRANQRHPFLTITPDGELAWTRVKNLTTAHRIVARKDSGGSGKVSLVQSKDASSLRSVEGCAAVTTSKRSGLTGGEPSATTMKLAATPDSSTATGSLLLNTTPCTSSRGDAAPFAASMRQMLALPVTGRTSSRWITVTIPAGCEHSSATTVMPGSDTLVLSKWHLPPQNISDFIAEQISSVEPDGEGEVFDLQVDRTENFIANGVVSHNTWWHDDDWAGRIQQAMESGEGDKFEIVKYPAINEVGDEYILDDDSIVEIPQGVPIPPGARMTRPHGTAIHPERYTTEAMLRIKRNAIAAGMKRTWDALYQQNPIPDEGNYFSKEYFRHYSTAPARRDSYVYQAWDFAISEGKDSDYNVGITIGVDHRDSIYVLNMTRFKTSDGNMLIETVVDYAKQWMPDTLGVEDGQIWKALESQFQKVCDEKKYWPSFEILKPLTDKMVRASPLRGRMQAGKVYFDKEATYWRDVQKEMLHFPAGKHDDIVDALAWAVRLTLTRSAPQRRDLPPEPKSWKDKLSQFVEGAISGASHMAS